TRRNPARRLWRPATRWRLSCRPSRMMNETARRRVTLAACYNPRVNRRAGIYIHIPFCARQCTYCAFNTTDYFEDLAARYIDAVHNEILAWGGRLAERDNPRLAVDTIYFGGGTPSIVEAAQLARLVAACREAFDVEVGAEVTIEINPS